MSRWPFARLVVFLVALLAWGLPAAASAQPSPDMPPRDVGVVVQPDAARLPPPPADFERIDRDWLVVEFPGSIRERAEALVKDAENFRGRLSADFGTPVLDHVIVRIARNPEQMTALAPLDAPPFDYAVGMAYPSVRLITLSLQAPETWEAPDLPEVLRHELTHMALTDAVASHHVPRWFNEGLAIYESGEQPYDRLKTLWEAVLHNRLLPLAELDRGFPSDKYLVNEAYAESADFVRFLMRDADKARFGALLQRVRAGSEFGRALEDSYSASPRTLEFQWHKEIEDRFGIGPMLMGGGLLWVLATGLVVAAWVKKRRHARAKLAEWAREEAELDAAIAASRREREHAAAAAAATVAPEDEAPPRAPSVPVVEHDGRWHTLH